MDVMDVANLSMQMSQSKVMDQIGTKVLKMALDSTTEQAGELTEMMEESASEAVHPDLGQHLDISV